MGGSLIPGGPIDVNVLDVCNLDVLGLGIIIVNEQSCNPTTGVLSVNALHIRVSPVIDLIAGHAQAGAFNTETGTPCGCATCDTV